jgi:uncharacterized OB-fold protein
MSDLSRPKPRPVPTPVSKPFWDALAQERVLLQRCDDCQAWVYYPRRRCPHCLSERVTWHEIAGRGSVFTFTITRQPTAPSFADETPQHLVVVELDEGVRVTGTLVAVSPAPGSVRIGARVEPVFDHGQDGMTLLRFRLVD